MFKLESFKINNFKNITNTDLALTDFNVVVGPNNSGKSNFLQTLSFLRWLLNADIKQVEQSLKSGAFSEFTNFIKNEYNRNDLEINVNYSNSKSNKIYFYSIKLRSSSSIAAFDNLYILHESLYFKSKSARGKPIKIFEQEEQKVSFGKDFPNTKLFEKLPSYVSVLRHLNIIISNEMKNYIEAFEGLDQIINAPIFFFSSSELRKRINNNPQSTLRFRSIYSNIRQNVLDLSKSQKWDNFIAVLKNTISVDDINFIEPKNESNSQHINFFLKQNGTSKLLDELSDGSLLIISLISEVLTSTSPVILIEEPENSLHPKALIELIHFLRDENYEKQFIITTHSTIVLNMIKPEEVIVARLDKKGNSTLEKIKNISELKRKLNSSYVSFGDLLIENIDEGETGEEKEY